MSIQISMANHEQCKICFMTFIISTWSATILLIIQRGSLAIQFSIVDKTSQILKPEPVAITRPLPLSSIIYYQCLHCFLTYVKRNWHSRHHLCCQVWVSLIIKEVHNSAKSSLSRLKIILGLIVMIKGWFCWVNTSEIIGFVSGFIVTKHCSCEAWE